MNLRSTIVALDRANLFADRPWQTYGNAVATENQTCNNCNRRGHWRVHCPLYRCRHCEKLHPGHMERDCPANNNGHCSVCGVRKPMHMPRDCPERRDEDIEDLGWDYDGDINYSAESA